MTTSEKIWVFDKHSAATYDRHWVKLSALKDVLHLFTRIVLSELPEDARILCVGAGTGEDIFGLAHHYPQWRFTAVDPSVLMITLSRTRKRGRPYSGK
jgi:tRNA (cmo5U34)-methyltransferase